MECRLGCSFYSPLKDLLVLGLIVVVSFLSLMICLSMITSDKRRDCVFSLLIMCHSAEESAVLFLNSVGFFSPLWSVSKTKQ